jgi:acyl-CoA thioesterase-1
MRATFKRNLCRLLVATLSALLAFSASTGQAADRPIRILALGDSLMQGYGLPPGTDFPTQLQQALDARGLNVTVINAGVSGDTSAGGLARLDWSLADRPDAAIVEFGGNDGLRGLSPAEMEKNIDGMLAKLKAANVPVLLAGMMSPRNWGPAYAAEFDAVFPRLAKKYGALFYPFYLEGVALDTALMQGDGLHPNPQGVKLIVARMTPLAVQLVAKAKGGPGGPGAR